MSNKNDKLIPNNRMEEYLNWLGGNTPKGDTLNPQNRQERFLEQIAVRLDNGTGGGGGSGFVELDSEEAVKEFVTPENEGKIAQYVGPDYEVDGSVDYVDRLTVSINEETFKNKVKGVGLVPLQESGSYDGFYVSGAEAISFVGLSQSDHAMIMISSSDEKYAEYPTVILGVANSSDGGTIIAAVEGASEVTPLLADLINPEESVTIVVPGSSAAVIAYIYATNTVHGDYDIPAGWHCATGIKDVAVTVGEFTGSSENVWSVIHQAFKGLGETEGAGLYNFKFNGQWTPAIAEYGVSVQGAADGDEIDIDYKGDGLYQVGKVSSMYLDTNKNFNNFEDGILLAGATESMNMSFYVSDHCLMMTDDDEHNTVICDSVSGWNARYAIYIPYMMNIFPITPITINNQDTWKDIISAAPLPNFVVTQKLANRIEVEVDADKYIPTVEGKGTETFTYDNGQWVTFGVAPGTTIDGAILSCEATTIYCNTITSVDDMNKAIADVIPEGSEQHAIVEYTGGGSGNNDYMNAFNQMGTYGGCFVMCQDFSEPGTIFNGAQAMAGYLGGIGFLVDAFDTQPHAQYQLVIPEEYKALVDSMFSLTPFQAQKTVIDIDAKGITVKGTPVNGDKLVVEYKDGELEKYELYRVQNIEGSKYYEAGDELEVMYFDTTVTPSNFTPFAFESGCGAIFVGENGIMAEGLYWAQVEEEAGGEIAIGTKLIAGSGAMIDPSTVVYTSSKGWVKNSTIINKTKLVESWTMRGMTITSDIEGAKKFVTKVPAGEEPEAQLELYKFYVSPGEESGSGSGSVLIDIPYEGSFDDSIQLTPEMCKLMQENDNTTVKIMGNQDGEYMEVYLRLDMVMKDSHYGESYLYGGTIEGMSGTTIMMQAVPSMGIAEIYMDDDPSSGGVTSLGGETGDISIGSGLSMSGNILIVQPSGVYEHYVESEILPDPNDSSKIGILYMDGITTNDYQDLDFNTIREKIYHGNNIKFSGQVFDPNSNNIRLIKTVSADNSNIIVNVVDNSGNITTLWITSSQFSIITQFKHQRL